MKMEVNVRSFIDDRKLSSMQIIVVFVCFMGAFLDGLDVVIIGFIAPTLKADWGLSNSDLAPIMSAAIAGLAVGALSLGPLSDWLGRKKVMILCLMGIAGFTILSATSATVTQLMIWRFLTGIFMGGILPQVVTVISDNCPKRLNARLVTVVISGYSIGSALGGFLAAWIIPDYGWKALLFVVGVLPLLLGLCCFKLIPESLGYMVLKKYPKHQIDKVARKIDKHIDLENVEFILEHNKAFKTVTNPVKYILGKNYFVRTLCLWWCYSMGVYTVFLLSGWLPILISSNGFDHTQASIISAFFQLGGPVGCIVAGYLMDKFDRYYGLALVSLGTIISLLAAVVFEPTYLSYSIICMFIGMWAYGTNAGFYSLSSMIYPVEVRSTGVGFMNGVARLGAIASVFAGAYMLNAGFTPQAVFLSIVFPVVTMIIITVLIRPKKTATENALLNVNA